MDAGKLKFFASYIESQIGIIYSDVNYFQLEHRLNDIAIVLGLKDSDSLWEMAKNGITGQFRDLLLDVATNNETSFFRDPAVFNMLTEHLVPMMKERYGMMNPLSVWSAAGSTGQEAYSIAMAWDQARRLNPGSIPDFSLFVSDFSERVLAQVKEGLYSQLEVQRGLPSRLLLEYFNKEDGNKWRIQAALRAKIQCQKINLLDPFPPNLAKFEFIFCRNVLIYQSVENRIAVVEKLTDHLTEEGYLILGAAESLLGISNKLKQVQFGNAVAYQR